MLTNAAAVLRCFGSDCAELTVTDVCARLGLPKASASRLLKAMREAGLLETIGDSKRHRPGRMFLNITAAFRTSSMLITLGAEAVARVSSACGHTGYVSVLDGQDAMAVTDHPGTNALRVVSSLGRRLPAHAAATGRTLLARLDPAEVARLYAGGLPPAPPAAPHTLAALQARLVTVRAQGFEEASDAAAPGIDALAVAVADPRQHEVASLCIVFPAAVVAAPERRRILGGLIEEAAAIARATDDGGFAASLPQPEGANA
jgi:DNA-binding IclR family transcriptional regulator